MTIYNPEREALALKVLNLMNSLNISQNIFTKFQEQYIFMLRSKLESMAKYTTDQFIAWYDNTL